MFVNDDSFQPLKYVKIYMYIDVLNLGGFFMEPTTAAAATTAASGGISSGGFMLAIMVFFIVMIMLSSRSQKKRDAEHKKQVSALKKGDQVVLLGGIIGTVVGFNQEILEVKVSENTKLSVLPSGIVTILNGNNLQQGDNK